MIFAERLKELRAARGMKQSELDNILHFSNGRTAMLETSYRMPTITEISTISRYFKVHPCWLAWDNKCSKDS